MDRFVDYMTTKRGMADALRASSPPAATRSRTAATGMTAAITRCSQAGAAAGTLRPDVEPADVLASLSGVTLAAGDPAQRDQAGRLLDLLMDGLRYQPTR